MEIIVVKEGVCERNMFDSGSKSSTGPKSDNSVNAVKKKETDKCRHFSIRAYVAEVRGKDWKICWPFSSLGDNEESRKESDMFPPLHVPEFRWWGCLSCLQRSDASYDAADIRLVSNCSAHNFYGSRTSNVNTSVDVISPELCPLTHYHMKVKVADVMSIIGEDLLSSENYSNIVVKDFHWTTKDSISSEMKVAQFANGKFCKGEETIKLDLENSGLVELVNPNCGSSEVNEGMLNCANNRFDKPFQNEKSRVSSVAKTSERVENMKCHQKPDLGTLENGVVGSRIGFHTSKLNPLEFTESDDDKEAHGFSRQILSSRRPQKFRLLTEILRRDVSGASAKISSSNGKSCLYDVNFKVTQTKAPDEHDGLGLDIPSRGQISVEKIVEKDTGGGNKKRKALHIEDREQRMSDEETTCIDCAIAISKSVIEGFVWEGLHSDFKSQYSVNRSDIKIIQGKKKNKTIRLSNGGSTTKGLHPSLRFNSAALGVGLTPHDYNDKAAYRKDVLSDLKISMGLSEGDRSTAYPDVNCRSPKTDIIPAKPSKEKASKRGFHGFVKYCMAPEETNEESALKNPKHEVHRVRKGKNSVLSHNKVMCKEDQVIGKEIGYATKVAPGTGSHLGLKIKKVTPRKASSSIEQDNINMFQLQDGASTIRSKDLSLICGYKNKTDVQGHSEDIKDQSNGRIDKTSELEYLNGIPVEIVELLAKHRHERRRLEADSAKENELCLSKNTKNVTDSKKSELCGFEDKKLSRCPLMEDLKMLKPRSNAVGSISAAGRSVAVEPVEESRACSSHLKQTCKGSASEIKQLEESHNRKDNFAYSFSPLNYSCGNQLSEVGTRKNLGVQGCRWYGDKLVPGSRNSSFQSLTSCPEGRIVSSPTRIKGSRDVSLKNVGGCPFRFESYQKSANLSQRRNRNFQAETFKKINAEQPCACTQKRIEKIPHPVGHRVLYSNETIPATQLLKLMGAGRSSKVSRNVDENMVFANRPSFPQITHHEGIFPTNGGLLGGSSGDYAAGMSSDYFPSVPISDDDAFPGHRNTSCVRRNLVSHKMGNDRVKYGARKRREISDSSTPTQTADCKLHRFGDGSRGLAQKHEFFSTTGVKADFHPPLNSMIVPLKSHLIEGSIEKMGVDKKVGTVGLVKGSCGTDICTLNRNPADFSIPEAGNEFTIGGEDFKFRKMVSKRGRPRLRMMKLLALKESAQI